MLNFFSSSVIKIVVLSVLGIISPFVFYYVVRTHFDAKRTSQVATKYQKNQILYNDLSIQMSDEMRAYKQKLHKEPLRCKQKVCNVSELKNALHF